ncbi:MAG TPA: hypothetical protein VJ853_07010 [Thermoanaerobaculia bacterium]|nr:hypothetical protein [Thermoanaerobaculia bacterium]
MTFYVEKQLALGPISFGVSPARPAGAPDDDPSLSTGPAGEFLRRRSEGFFFGGQDRFAGPTLPAAPTISSKPFWESLKGGSPARTYGFYALMLLGVLLVLLGFSVVATKGPQGWVEVILGLILIAIPIALTAQQRRKIREEEERQRAEREAIEKRNREMLAAYTAALGRAQNERTPEAFAALDRERQALTLPKEIWSPAARRAVLLIGFDELAKKNPKLADVIHRASSAAGLAAEDETSIKNDIYGTVVWHLLADDRLGAVQARQLAAIRENLGVEDTTAGVVQQFQRLRGLTPQTLPKTRCSTQLGFGEHCVHETPIDGGTLHVTNKRVLVDRKKRLEIPIAHAFDVVANADDSVITVKTDNPKKPLKLRVEQPVYSAAMLDLAASIDERPRGFA